MVSDFDHDFFIWIRLNGRPIFPALASIEDIRGPNNAICLGVQTGAERVILVDHSSRHWSEPDDIEYIENAPRIVSRELEPGFRHRKIVRSPLPARARRRGSGTRIRTDTETAHPFLTPGNLFSRRSAKKPASFRIPRIKRLW